MIEYFINLSKRKSILIAACCASMAIILMQIDYGYAYFTKTSLAIECLLAVCVIEFGKYCPKKLVGYLEYIGSITLPIYFWHIVVLNFGLDSEMARKSIMAAIVRPALTIGIMSAVIYCMQIAAKRLGVNKILGIVSGVRI